MTITEAKEAISLSELVVARLAGYVRWREAGLHAARRRQDVAAMLHHAYLLGTQRYWLDYHRARLAEHRADLARLRAARAKTT